MRAQKTLRQLEIPHKQPRPSSLNAPGPRQPPPRVTASKLLFHRTAKQNFYSTKVVRIRLVNSYPNRFQNTSATIHRPGPPYNAGSAVDSARSSATRRWLFLYAAMSNEMRSD
ncbi:hypothetical protein HC928_24530 [bacterium]|nr:hypothetical protein [bacterium]